MICGAAGLYAVPVMMYAIASTVLLLLADRWAEVKRRLFPLILALLAMAIATALLYAPVISRSGVSALVANPFVIPEGIGTIPAELAARCKDVAMTWGENASGLFVPFLCAGTLLCVFAVIWGGGDRFLLLAPAGIAVAVAAAFAQRRVAPGRAYIYLQPWMIACACAATAQLARQRRVWRIGVALILIAIAANNWFKVKNQPLLNSEDPHEYVEASQVAAKLIGWGLYRGDTAVVWDSAENLWPPLLYYLIQTRPEQGQTVAWRDSKSKTVFIVLSRNDGVDNFLRERPELASMYGAPELVGETANSNIYSARRR